MTTTATAHVEGLRKKDPNRVTFYVAIFEQEQQPTAEQIKREDWLWRPWINCKPEDRADGMLNGLAIHRHMRNRGGIRDGDKRLKLWIVVKDQPDADTVTFTEFNIWPK